VDLTINSKRFTLLNDESTYRNNNQVLLTFSPQLEQTKTKFIDIPIQIKDQDGKAFIDSGCSFNAISSAFAKRCNLTIEDYGNDISCEVGGGSRIKIKRRVTRCDFNLFDLGNYSAYVFVMDPIPFGYDAIFGLDFLNKVNPIIDWPSQEASYR
jgi:hypothetical protein